MSDKDSKSQAAKNLNGNDWPDTIRTREALDLALEAGEKSGISTRNVDEIFEDALTSLKNG